MSARRAVVTLFRGELEWRLWFRRCCEAGVSRLWSQAYQLRDELQERGEWHSLEDIGDVLLSLAREKLPESPGAQWEEWWASTLCSEALERLTASYSGLSEDGRDRLDLSGQDPWHDRMNAAGEANDPAAFRAALVEWERAGLQAFSRAARCDKVAS
jgi:hypothetical protein